MDSPSAARVDFTWKWEPNKLGDAFDASSAAVKGFSTWDRATLIQKYGAAFYHAEPTRAAVRLAKKDGQWQVASE